MSRLPTPDPITALDLFSGCGGFTQGFHEFRPEGQDTAGGPFFRSIAAVESDLSAAATYAANFGSLASNDEEGRARVHVGKIEAWSPNDEEMHADVIVGGPPCQGFSSLNRKKVGPERNSLWREYVRIVHLVKPKIFVIENVEHFLRSPEFEDLLTEVKQGGLLEDYRLVDPPGADPEDSTKLRTSRYVLNSADYGAVQARRRAIVIGIRKDCENASRMTYPTPTHASPSKIAKSGQQRLFDAPPASFQPRGPVDIVFGPGGAMYYVALNAGSALGRNCGPLLISKRQIHAEQVAMGQLHGVLGVPDGSGTTLQKFWTTIQNIPETSLPTLAVSIAVWVIILGSDRTNPQIPGAPNAGARPPPARGAARPPHRAAAAPRGTRVGPGGKTRRRRARSG